MSDCIGLWWKTHVRVTMLLYFIHPSFLQPWKACEYIILIFCGFSHHIKERVLSITYLLFSTKADLGYSKCIVEVFVDTSWRKVWIEEERHDRRGWLLLDSPVVRHLFIWMCPTCDWTAGPWGHVSTPQPPIWRFGFQLQVRLCQSSSQTADSSPVPHFSSAADHLARQPPHPPSFALPLTPHFAFFFIWENP